MSQNMWKVPASPEFIKYLRAIGFTDNIPDFEHSYLGSQLTSRNSLAQRVEVNENSFRIMHSIMIENRQFYFDFSQYAWFVMVDGDLL